MAALDALLAGLRAAAEPTRLRILALLGEGELTVNEIADILGQSQPRISRHLKLMVEGRLIERHKEGGWAFFRLSEAERSAGLPQVILNLVDAHDSALNADRERLDAVRARRAAAAAAYFRRHAFEWDRLRALHVDEADVEEAMLAAFGSGRLDALLDLGAGTGRVLELFAHRIRRGLGIDINHDMLAVARSNFDRAGLRHVQVRHGDVNRLGVEADSFEAAVIHQVLHFLDDPARAVREAARALRAGGKLLVVDFAPHDLEFLRTDHAHRRLGFGAEEVRGFMRSAGLVRIVHRDLKPTETGRLTVSLWIGRKSAEPHENERPKENAA